MTLKLEKRYTVYTERAYEDGCTYRFISKDMCKFRGKTFIMAMCVYVCVYMHEHLFMCMRLYVCIYIH